MEVRVYEVPQTTAPQQFQQVIPIQETPKSPVKRIREEGEKGQSNPMVVQEIQTSFSKVDEKPKA